MSLKKNLFELLIWVSAIFLLALNNPFDHQHFSLCPIANFGLNWCPGCGLGRSISSLLNFDVKSSLKFHWFGIPSLIIILHRIFILLK